MRRVRTDGSYRSSLTNLSTSASRSSEANTNQASTNSRTNLALLSAQRLVEEEDLPRLVFSKRNASFKSRRSTVTSVYQVPLKTCTLSLSATPMCQEQRPTQRLLISTVLTFSSSSIEEPALFSTETLSRRREEPGFKPSLNNSNAPILTVSISTSVWLAGSSIRR